MKKLIPVSGGILPKIGQLEEVVWENFENFFGCDAIECHL